MIYNHIIEFRLSLKKGRIKIIELIINFNFSILLYNLLSININKKNLMIY